MDEDSKGPQRRRRSTTRYSGEYNLGEISDLASSDAEQAEKPTVKRAKRHSGSYNKGRSTKECPACASQVPLSSKTCSYCDHPFPGAKGVYSEQESASIRERFAFEPEKEDDGTLKIDKILGRRRRKSGGRRWMSPVNQNSGKSAIDTKFEYEYLIKFKGMSHLHVQWLTANDIEGMGLKSRQALNRYLNLLDKGVPSVAEDGEFDTSYCEIERILDVKEEEVEELVADDSISSPEQGDEAKAEEPQVEERPARRTLSETKAIPHHTENTVDPAAEQMEVEGEKVASDGQESAPGESAPKTPFEVYKPVMRCQKVLDKIWDDTYAGPFHDPVDLELFPDYGDVVDEPMCLTDIRTKLEKNEYKGNPHAFARDMRLVWKNCKIYNVHKSPIWNAAHYLSMMFERLFQAWVVSFQDGTIGLSDPIARPWESTCRVCLSDQDEEKMLLCDHCDAAYHIFCLVPPMEKVPDGAWVCPRCTSYLGSEKSRMLSASAEEKAREDAENSNARRIKRVKKKKYLVKWRGLSYKDSTWETPEDLGYDEKIADYHRINDNPPDEPPLTQEEINRELSKRQHAVTPAMVKGMLQEEVEAQTYAQIRTYHFLRWNDIPPDALLKECGAATFGYVYDYRAPMCVPKALEADLMHRASPKKERVHTAAETKVNSAAPSEVMDKDVKLEQTVPAEDVKGLFWFYPEDYDPVKADVAEALGDIVYHVTRGTRPIGPGGPCQDSEYQVCLQKGQSGLYMNIGDCKDRVVVLGFRTMADGKPGPAEASGKIKVGDVLVAINGYRITHLRFQEIIQVLQRNDPFLYLRFFRPKTTPYSGVGEPSMGMLPIEPRKRIQNNRPAKQLTSRFRGVSKLGDKWAAQIWYNGTSHRLGFFDNEVEAAKEYDEAAQKYHGTKAILNFHSDGSLSATAKSLAKQFSALAAENAPPVYQPPPLSYPVGTFNNNYLFPTVEEEVEVRSDASYDTGDSDTELLKSDGESDSQKSSGDEAWDSDAGDGEWRPKEETEMDGPLGRLLRAVNESDYPPERKEWEEYVIELGYGRSANSFDGRLRQVEQIDLATGNSIKVWESLASAARSLNIPPAAISAVVRGKNDNAGGFMWRYVAVKAAEPAPAAGTKDPKKDDNLTSKLYTKTKIYKGGNTLREYQLEGLNWLLRCWYGKRSCILADEMGLGKTVQIVCFLEHLFEAENMKGPFLVAVPLSTIEHWKREVEAWSTMNLCVYHDTGGGREMRDVIREFEWYYKNRSRRLLKFHILVTTYDDLIKDYEELAEVPWRAVIVDEAHRLRNVNSKLLECLKAIVQRGITAYGYQHRILMTGTPLQNNTQELWSLLNFIEPAKFPDMDKFYEKFGVIRTQDQVEQLQKRLAPHLLRRVKEDVAADIPPKEETIIDVELTSMQKQYYRAIFEHNHAFLMQGTKGSLPKLMNIQMELRKCCNHPFLIAGVEEKEMDALIERFPPDGMSEKEYRIHLQRKRVEELLVPSSGKLVLFDKLLPKLKREGHKLLVFSQMVRMLDLLEEYCDVKEYKCERLDGRVQGNDRQLAIDRFNRNEDSFVFLLSTRAGGVGINLTAADTVIIFDSDWNPQNDIQAQARCHRIGQVNAVSIYRLITRRSFESEMFERASMKLGLEQAVLGTNAFSDRAAVDAKMDSKEMEQLLRQGAYAILEEDESAIKEFCEKDIDRILEERSHVRVVDGPTPMESWLNKKKKVKTRKSLFTGASSAEHADIDVNDPDFWRKVLPDLVTPDMMQVRLDKGEPEENDDTQKAYFKDLQTMVEGMQDLMTKGQLPERERNSCVNLLLQITLKETAFTAKQRAMAEQWQQQFEGTRNRTKKSHGPYKDSDSEYDEVTGRKKKGKGRTARGRKLTEDEWEPDKTPGGSKKKLSKGGAKKRKRDLDFIETEGEIKRAAAAVRRYRRPSQKKRAAEAAVMNFLKTQLAQNGDRLDGADYEGDGEEDVTEGTGVANLMGLGQSTPSGAAAALGEVRSQAPDHALWGNAAVAHSDVEAVGRFGAAVQAFSTDDDTSMGPRRSSRGARKKLYSEYEELAGEEEPEVQDDNDEDYNEFEPAQSQPQTRRERNTGGTHSKHSHQHQHLAPLGHPHGLSHHPHQHPHQHQSLPQHQPMSHTAFHQLQPHGHNPAMSQGFAQFPQMQYSLHGGMQFPLLGVQPPVPVPLGQHAHTPLLSQMLLQTPGQPFHTMQNSHQQHEHKQHGGYM